MKFLLEIVVLLTYKKEGKKNVKVLNFSSVFFSTLSCRRSFQSEFPLERKLFSLCSEEKIKIRNYFKFFDNVDQAFNKNSSYGPALIFLFKSFLGMYISINSFNQKIFFKSLLLNNKTQKDSSFAYFFPFGYSFREMIEAAKDKQFADSFNEEKKEEFLNFLQDILERSPNIRRVNQKKVEDLVFILKTLNPTETSDFKRSPAVSKDQGIVNIQIVKKDSQNKLSYFHSSYLINFKEISNVFQSPGSLYYRTFQTHERETFQMHERAAKLRNRKKLIASGLVVGGLAFVAHNGLI